MTKKLKGYMTSLEVNGSRFPHRIQNILIREYCNRLNRTYLFSLTEVSVAGAHLVLKDLLSMSDQYDGVVFFSIYTLPKAPDLRREVYQLLHLGKEIHFCMEQLTVLKKEDIPAIENILAVRESLNQVPFGGRYAYEKIRKSEFIDFLEIKPDTY